MNPNEWAEYQYAYQERLGILCGTSDPKWDQINMAIADGNEVVRRMRLENMNFSLATTAPLVA